MVGFRETTAGSTFPLNLMRLSLIVVLAIVLTGCSSDDIKCWPFCSSSSSGVTTTIETVAATTETTCTDVASITVTYPAGGESLGGGTHTVKWTKSCSVEKVRIDVYDNTNAFVRWLGDKDTETDIAWEIQEPNGLYRIKVTSDDDTSVYDYSDFILLKTHKDDHLTD